MDYKEYFYSNLLIIDEHAPGIYYFIVGNLSGMYNVLLDYIVYTYGVILDENQEEALKDFLKREIEERLEEEMIEEERLESKILEEEKLKKERLEAERLEKKRLEEERIKDE